jgi:hypothetical protein
MSEQTTAKLRPPAGRTRTPAGRASVLDSYEAHGCRVNAIDPIALFERYAEAGFLYEEKRVRLRPYMPTIVENWRRALRAGELVHWVATYDGPSPEAWASISSWRSTHTGWNTQHLVSIGGPAGSRAVMLAGQGVRIGDGFDGAHENWYRPENRLPNRLFGSIVQSLGAENAAVIPYVLMSVTTSKAAAGRRETNIREQLAPSPVGISTLALRCRGPVFVAAEELEHEDLLLESIDDLYRMVGLRRYRRIWVAWDGDRPVGAAIAWRGPLGFNFSFLENRCDLLLDPELPPSRRESLLRGLLRAASTAYGDLETREIPLVVTESDEPAAIAAGARPIRRYTQSIWLRPGFPAMYDHFARFYRRIGRVHERRGPVAQ